MLQSVALQVSRRLITCPLFREPRVLAPTDGSRTIAEAGDIFTGDISQGFGEIGVSGVATDEMGVFLCDQSQGIDCRCAPNLTRGSVSIGTQHQVVEFGATHLRDLYEERGMEIWFPFQHANQLYVAGMYLMRHLPTVRLIPLPGEMQSSLIRDGSRRVVILQPI